jgi:outer membrane murein-binding lipoprotein Lpp
MRRYVLVAVLAAALLAGCGGDDKQDTFAKDFRPINGDIQGLGRKVGNAVSSARGKSDVALANQFSGLADQVGEQRKKLDGLDPPDDLKSDTDDMTSALRKVEKDLRGISKAARGHDAEGARSSTEALVRDSEPLRTARRKIERGTKKD